MSQDTDTMNCEEYTVAIAADPAFAGGVGHLAQCDACQTLQREMLAFDRKLLAAFDIAVPPLRMPDLANIDSVNVTALPTNKRRAAPGWLAVAATVLVAAFVGLQINRVDVSHTSLTAQLLDHMDHEPYAMQVSNKAVSDKRLARVVPANIATMSHEAGLITYAQSCEINGHEVPHLVIQGQQGPITILLMPEEMIDATQQVNGESIHGFIIPVGDGSIAIIGEKEEQLDNVRETVLSSVKWSST